MTRPALLRRLGLGVGVLLVLALVVTGALAWTTVRSSLPTTSGELPLAGLSGPVTVERDARGVPTIFADTPTDLFRAQGYVNAQDRFFEMDLRRHITAGRLSELVGEAGLDTDKVVRTLDWRGVASEELPLLDPTTRQYLQAYADGVNAWIHAQGSTGDMALEYTVLGIRLPDYRVEDWTPVDSLTWLKAMAWDLKGDYVDELTRAQLARRMSLKQIAEIYPTYPYAVRKPVLSPGNWPPSPQATPAAPAQIQGVRATAADLGAGAAAFANVQAALDAVPQLVGRGDGVGSNAWVLAGSHTTTGKPILANDPHLAVSIPGIWVQGGLQCRQVSAACPFSVSGFGFSGVPGIVIGHNASIAWGFTNLPADTADFYLEKLNGDKSLKDGAWTPLTMREETIKVAGGTDQTLMVKSTRHGPVLSDVLPAVQAAGDGAPVTGGDANATYAVTLAWTGLVPGRTMDAVFAFNTATTFAAFRKAATAFAVPSQNLLYADTAGHIGYQTPGLIPQRVPAFADSPPGYWPAPGWSSSYDWKGFVPFEQLPWTLDPAEGVLVSANQPVTAASAPFLTTEWDYGFRAKRISDLLALGGKQSVESTAALQLDNRNLFADTLVANLLAVDLSKDPFTKEAQDLLRGWDKTTPANDAKSSAAAAYFNAVWANLVRLTFDDELPPGLQANGGGQWMQAMIGLLGNPKSTWWDNKSTPGVVESNAEILRQALVSARLELTKKLGKIPTEWRWGKLHTLTLTHRILGSTSSPWIVREVFNRGGYEMPGGGSMVNANAWDASVGYAVTRGPSMRMVVDLGSLDSSVWVNQTGQSGHPYSSHYDDQIDAWVEGRTFPWPFATEAVTKASKDQLRLVPSQKQ